MALSRALPAGTYFAVASATGFVSQLFDGLPCPGACDPAACDPCVDAVCNQAQHSECCDNLWDDLCIAQLTGFCGEDCS